MPERGRLHIGIAIKVFPAFFTDVADYQHRRTCIHHRVAQEVRLVAQAENTTDVMKLTCAPTLAASAWSNCRMWVSNASSQQQYENARRLVHMQFTKQICFLVPDVDLAHSGHAGKAETLVLTRSGTSTFTDMLGAVLPGAVLALRLSAIRVLAVLMSCSDCLELML